MRSRRAARPPASRRSGRRALLPGAARVPRLGDAQKLLNQNRRRHAVPGSSPRTRMAACFSNMPGSRPSAPGQLAADRLSQPPEDQDSLAAGKNAGNFLNSAVFCENLSRKHLRIQLFAYEFPTHTGQGIFLPAQGINSAGRESQGIRRKTDPLAPTLPIAPKFFQAVDKNITNRRIRYIRGRTRLASPERPRIGCAYRAPDQIRRRA